MTWEWVDYWSCVIGFVRLFYIWFRKNESVEKDSQGLLKSKVIWNVLI